jgi:vacuolar protein sorting-associated protein 26
VFTENETIAKYEIMDGAPVKGESIPIRVFLAGYDLTPTMRDINKKFSVRYFLNLVLMDTEDRRYFKQQEITLWRKSEKTRKSLSNSGSGAIGGGSESTSNLTVAQQNAQMPTHLVQGTSAIHPPMMESIGGPLGNQTSPGVSQTEQSHMGLFTAEDSPQHEATESKVRSNPLAFDTDEDKTPSKEENPPVPTSKEPPQQQQSIGESSSLFEFSNDAAAEPPPDTANSEAAEASTESNTEDASTTN